MKKNKMLFIVSTHGDEVSCLDVVKKLCNKYPKEK